MKSKTKKNENVKKFIRVGIGNAIFSRDPHSWHRCSGPEYVKEVVGPSKIPFFFRYGVMQKQCATGV